MSSSEPATVLVVDDEPDVADAYAAQLQNEFIVSTAYGGQEALDKIDDSVNVVLLDRRMPGISGDEAGVPSRDCRASSRSFGGFVALLDRLRSGNSRPTLVCST